MKMFNMDNIFQPKNYEEFLQLESLIQNKK